MVTKFHTPKKENFLTTRHQILRRNFIQNRDTIMHYIGYLINTVPLKPNQSWNFV